MNVDHVLLASPYGFCAGVQMAIRALHQMTQMFAEPVYCYHEIVHNRQVVERFENLGVIFVNSIDDVPQGAPLMLSAHGSAPEVIRAAHAKCRVVDAVCPLVNKVHSEAAILAKRGYTIIYMGHAGHDEVVGTLAVAPESIRRVETADEVRALRNVDNTAVAFLAQTTLTHREWAGVLDAVKERWPDVWIPKRSDICFATTNRQSALLEVVKRGVESVVVVSSANSSNGMALVRVAENAGCPRVVRVDSAQEIPPDLSGTVVVTAAASTSPGTVREVISALNPKTGVEIVSIGEEEEHFSLPGELRSLARSLSFVPDDRVEVSGLL